MPSLPLRQVHIDFHTSEHIPDVGSKFDSGAFATALKGAHINSANIFAKCHHGWSYYDTKVGVRHPNLKFDLLSAQMDACKKAGIAAVIYYSIGWDERAAFLHPEWREVAPDGGFRTWGGGNLDASWKSMCLNSSYLDYCMAQISELAKTFPQADGFWLDIIFMNECCCSNCRRSIEAKGRDWQDPSHRQKEAYARRERYFEAANAAARVVAKDLPVFHNSGHLPQGDRQIFRHFSHLEIESLPTGGWGYDHFPLSAAYARTLRKPYLGMTGKFHTMWGEFGGYKHPNALSYECALMLAFGAGCSVGDQLHPTGAIDESTYALIGHALREVEAVEPWVINAKPVAEVALFSASSLLAPGRTDDEARKIPADHGAARVLLESHFLFDVVDRYSDFSEYKLLILPDLIRLDGDLAERIEVYRRGGGRILLSGESGFARSENRFAIEVGATTVGVSPFSPDFVLPFSELRPDFVNEPFVMYAPSHRLQVTSGRSLGQVFDPYFNRTGKHFCSHMHTPPRPEPSGFDAAVLHDGVLYLAHPVFSIYQDKGAVAVKRYVEAAINLLLEKRRISTNLPSFGRVALTRQDHERRSVIHLLCASPFYRGSFHRGPIEVVEDLTTLADVQVTLRVDRPIARVTLEPEGLETEFKQNDGEIVFTVSRVAGRQIVAVHDA
jgi:Hypothetical glycosyl hydrolase 6/Beta-galactosidase trimerisation domain